MRANMVDVDRDTMRSLLEEMLANNMAATHAAIHNQASRA